MTVPDSDKIVVDTYVWVEYFKGSGSGAKARRFIEGDFERFTPSIVIAELSDKYRRDKIDEWEIRKRFIKLKSKILVLDENTADLAGEIKLELRKKRSDAGIADAIIAAHARRIDARILTGDAHLKGLKNSIDIS